MSKIGHYVAVCSGKIRKAHFDHDIGGTAEATSNAWIKTVIISNGKKQGTDRYPNWNNVATHGGQIRKAHFDDDISGTDEGTSNT